MTPKAANPYLKTRIMGGAGHLSNQQAFEAVRQVIERCERRDAILYVPAAVMWECSLLARLSYSISSAVMKRRAPWRTWRTWTTSP